MQICPVNNLCKMFWGFFCFVFFYKNKDFSALVGAVTLTGDLSFFPPTLVKSIETADLPSFLALRENTILSSFSLPG